MELGWYHEQHPFLGINDEDVNTGGARAASSRRAVVSREITNATNERHSPKLHYSKVGMGHLLDNPAHKADAQFRHAFVAGTLACARLCCAPK